MAQVKTYTGTTIKRKTISDFLTQEKNQRDKLQNLIVASTAHAKINNNDFTLLSYLVNGLKERRTRNLKAITQYILDHVNGISWQKLADGSFGYKTIKGATVEYKEFTGTWYNHKDNVQQVATLNLSNRIKGLLTSIEKAINGDMKAEDMTPEQLREAKAQLEGLQAQFNA